MNSLTIHTHILYYTHHVAHLAVSHTHIMYYYSIYYHAHVTVTLYDTSRGIIHLSFMLLYTDIMY